LDQKTKTKQKTFVIAYKWINKPTNK